MGRKCEPRKRKGPSSVSKGLSPNPAGLSRLKREKELTFSERLLLLPLSSLLLFCRCLFLSLTLFRRRRLLLRHTLLLSLPSPLQAAKPPHRPTTTMTTFSVRSATVSRVECHFGKIFLKFFPCQSETFPNLECRSRAVPRWDSRMFYVCSR
jgi:hypothetical protein